MMSISANKLLIFYVGGVSLKFKKNDHN